MIALSDVLVCGGFVGLMLSMPALALITWVVLCRQGCKR
jgi:hypothetical protein